MVQLHRDQLPTTIDLTNHIFFGNSHICVVGRGGHHTTHGHDRRPSKTRRISWHDNQSDALMLGGFGIGATSQPHIITLVSARGVDLVAIDDPFIAIEYC